MPPRVQAFVQRFTVPRRRQSSSEAIPGPDELVEGTGDHGTSIMRLLAADNFLDQVIKECRVRRLSVDFPDLESAQDRGALSAKLISFFQIWKSNVNNNATWTKCARSLENAFLALSPFAKYIEKILRSGRISNWVVPPLVSDFRPSNYLWRRQVSVRTFRFVRDSSY